MKVYLGFISMNFCWINITEMKKIFKNLFKMQSGSTESLSVCL